VKRLVEIAESQLGRGESTRNNRGPDIWRWRRGERRRGSWCAVFVLWCLEESWRPGDPWCAWLHERGVDRFDRFDRRGYRLASAKALTNRAGAAGHVLRRGEDPRPGDLVCWHRPRNGVITWKGHVGIITSYGSHDHLHAIEGNRGPFPAKVERYDYRAGSWRRGLYRIVRPPEASPIA
jgi:hypothetical protein